MGSSFQAPSLSLSTSSSYSSPNLLFSHSKLPSIWRSKCKFQPRIMAAYEPTSLFRFCRRDLLLSTSLTLILPPKGVGAEEDVKMADFVDDINAYTYSYPVEFPSKKRLFKWVESRKPERYSSAAPLSPNARLRIVSERVDFIDNLIISVSIGPPNPDFLKSKDKSTWNAKDVADSVLSDKSALRVTSSQRLAESSILDAYASEIDGERYWFYEYLVRKSPTKSVLEPSNFRQYVASTVERDDRPPVTRHQRKMDELKDALAKLETQLTSTQANQTTLATRLSAVEKTAPFEGSEPNGPMAELVSIVRRLEEQVSLSTNNSIHTENARIYSPLDNDTTRKKWHSYGHNPWESWPFSSE